VAKVAVDIVVGPLSALVHTVKNAFVNYVIIYVLLILLFTYTFCSIEWKFDSTSSDTECVSFYSTERQRTCAK